MDTLITHLPLVASTPLRVLLDVKPSCHGPLLVSLAKGLRLKCVLQAPESREREEITAPKLQGRGHGTRRRSRMAVDGPRCSTGRE